MIGRLLCRLGLHRIFHVRFSFNAYNECDRCGRRWYL